MRPSARRWPKRPDVFFFRRPAPVDSSLPYELGEGPAAPAGPRIERRADGALYAVAGASRSGKTLWTAQQVARERRLLVWDYPKGEWAVRYRCTRVSTFRELYELTKPGAPPRRLAFLRVSEKPGEDFENWARLAWGYVQAHGGPVVAEELSSVTHPGKAPPAWGNVCRMGLGYGANIFALSQRPSESDKTALGNATVIRAGRMAIPDDEQLLARYLRVPVRQVAALQPLDYIQRDARTGQTTHGRVNPRLRT
jgi:hypothetical protein